MDLVVAHLFEHPQHTRSVATWIYDAFWADRQAYSVDTLERLLRDAADPDRIPLSLLAFVDGQPVGTVNLIDNDDKARPHLHPWLAALVVDPRQRGRGVGSALVQALADHAHRLGFGHVYLDTDIPAFYARLGARPYERTKQGLDVMRLPCPVTR